MKGHNYEELKAVPGKLESVAGWDEAERDIIKTHLTYLEKLEHLTDPERDYFIYGYFPYLKLVAFKPDTWEPGSFEPVTPPKMTELMDEFRRRYHFGLRGVELRAKATKIISVCVAVDYTHYASGQCVRLDRSEYHFGYTTGIVSFCGNELNGSVVETLNIKDYYSIFVKYEGDPVVHSGSNYSVGEDGE